MMRKFIFQIDPIVLLIGYLVPFVLLYFFHGISPHFSAGLYLISLIIEFIWLWELNKAVSDLTDSHAGMDKLLSAFLLLFFLSNALSVLCIMERDLVKEYIERMDSWVVTRTVIQMKLLFSIVVTTLMTIRLKKVLAERTTWFMFIELLLPVIAMINITPLISSELKSKNYL